MIHRENDITKTEECCAAAVLRVAVVLDHRSRRGDRRRGGRCQRETEGENEHEWEERERERERESEDKIEGTCERESE